jgi:hypothetical protein
MISNVWEEQEMSDPIYAFHEEELKKMGIPKWANVKCPFCNSELPIRSIRSITIKFNTRNMGDLAIEIICDKCQKMDTVYFRKEIEVVTDVIPLLTGEKNPKSKPIVEEDMYGLNYNNVLDKMVEKDKNKEIKSYEFVQKGNM